MKKDFISVLVTDLHLPLDAVEGDVCFMAKSHLTRAKILPSDASCRPYRKSVDARKKNDVHFVWSVVVTGGFSERDLKRILEKKVPGVVLLSEEEMQPVFGSAALVHPPVIVGSGPAGLFSALLLARYGYAPILIERGGSVQERTAAIRKFECERVLDPETNVQFGAGGAGTFSDGKLVTRIHDPLVSEVLRTFVRHGAPEEILLLAKPHIGTDHLSRIVSSMTDEIVRLGGQVLYHTRMDRLSQNADGGWSVSTTRGEIPAGAVILATGHSARDTYDILMKRGIAVLPKPFSVGVRVEHLQEDIDRALYGRFADHPALGHAEYHLSYNTSERGVYSFCMCPGGRVMAAASEEGGVVVNGMSNYLRNGENANSAIAVSVFPDDYGNTPAGAMAFQRQIERAAFAAGGGDYGTPLITLGDFLAGREVTEPTRVRPTYMDGQAYRIASPERYLPPVISDALRAAFPAFGRMISGFDSHDALLCGAETRTSSPLRVPRDPATRMIPGYPNLYPVGEGAGYAGGITSAAVDGLRSALAFMAAYAPFHD